MRSNLWMLAALIVLVPPSAAPASGQGAVEPDPWCAQDHGGVGARHCEVREATLPAAGLLAVDARPNGGIEASGADRSEVRLRVRIVARAASEAEARELARTVRIETEGTVRAVGPERRKAESWDASFRLEVPRDARLRLQAGNGGLRLADVAGDAELQTVNGALRLARLGGRVRGDTVNGAVDLTLAGSGWQGEGLDVRTTNGALRVEIPTDYNAHLEASTVNGAVRTELAFTSSRLTGGRIETALGRGGRPIRLRTTNGALDVRRR